MVQNYLSHFSRFINKTLKIFWLIFQQTVFLGEGFFSLLKTSSWHLFSLHSKCIKTTAHKKSLLCHSYCISSMLPSPYHWQTSFWKILKKSKWHVGKGQNCAKVWGRQRWWLYRSHAHCSINIYINRTRKVS